MTNRFSRPHGTVRFILFVCTLGMSHQLLAQQAGQPIPPVLFPSQPVSPQNQAVTPPTPSKPTNDSGNTQPQAAPDPKVPQNDRIFWTLPNYLTVENVSAVPPITVRKKFKLTAEEDLDPVEFGFVFLAAGVNQATNANPTFGQGIKGYGKRFALELADNTIENFTVDAIFPSMLHQDPRYYQLAKGGFLRRFGYSVSRVVVTRSDAGKAEFNFSEIFGAATSAAISNAYHPGPRTLGSSFNVWATQVAWDAAGFEMKEFWPDIHRYLTRRHH